MNLANGHWSDRSGALGIKYPPDTHWQWTLLYKNKVSYRHTTYSNCFWHWKSTPWYMIRTILLVQIFVVQTTVQGKKQCVAHLMDTIDRNIHASRQFPGLVGVPCSMQLPAWEIMHSSTHTHCLTAAWQATAQHTPNMRPTVEFCANSTAYMFLLDVLEQYVPYF
jgi:hypothetical protein